MENEINFEQELYKAFGQVKDFTLGMQIAKWFYDKGRKYHEPVSEDLEKIVEEIAEPTILNAYGTKELARRLRNTIYGTSVSDDLEEAANFYADTHTEWFDADNNPHVSPAFKAGAQWQKEKDMQKFLHSETATFTREEFDAEMGEVRKQTQKQMMKDAVDAVVTDVVIHNNSDELKYNVCYPIGKRPFNKGDKVKLIIIKED